MYPTLPGVSDAPRTAIDLGSKKFFNIPLGYLDGSRLTNASMISKKGFIAMENNIGQPKRRIKVDREKMMFILDNKTNHR